MSKLWILLAVSLVLAYLIENRDHELRNIGSKHQDRMITLVLILVLGFFCGLRTWGNDTTTYLQMYEQMPLLPDFWDSKIYNFANGIGFGFWTSILKTFGYSPQDYLMFYAFVTVIPYVLFVRRYSISFSFGIFLMFATGFYTFSLAAIKQSMATGICLLAVTCALERRWLRYLLLILLASLFHPYAVIYLLVPFLDFKPLSARTYLYMAVFMVAGFFLESLLGTVLDVTDMMGATYTEDSFTGEGVNIFRVSVCFAPVILALLYGENLFRTSTRTDNLMFNMAMVNALIMFVGLFGTANYFARLANYFLPAQVITLPWLLSQTHPKDRKLLTHACVVGYLGYFIYENAIIRPFDSCYEQMSFWEYISSLLAGGTV